MLANGRSIPDYRKTDGIEPYYFPVGVDQGAKLVELGVKTAIDAKQFLSDQAHEMLAPIYNGVNGLAVGPDGKGIYTPVPEQADQADAHADNLTDDFKNIAKEVGAAKLGDAVKNYGGKALEGVSEKIGDSDLAKKASAYVGDKVGDNYGDLAKKAAGYVGDKALDSAAGVVADKAVDKTSDLIAGKSGAGEKPGIVSTDKATASLDVAPNTKPGDSTVTTPRPGNGIPYYLDANPPPASISANPPPNPTFVDSLTTLKATPAPQGQVGPKP